MIKLHRNIPAGYVKKGTTSVTVEEEIILNVLRLGYSPSEAFACGVRILNDRGQHTGKRYRQQRASLQLRAVSVWDEAENMEQLLNNGYTFTQAFNVGAEELTRPGISKTKIVRDQAREILADINRMKQEAAK